MNPQIFISHSSDDRPMVDKLMKLLVISINGLDREDIRYTSRADTGLSSGESIRKQLQSDICGCDCFVIVVSDSYLSSQYCAWELGAWAGAQKSKVVAAYLPGIDPARIGGILSDMHLLPLTKGDSVHQLVKEVASASPQELKCSPQVDDIEEFCNQAKAHPAKPVEKWRQRLVRLEEGIVFLNAYGLSQKPVRRRVFQNFHPAGPNIQPVQYLWADPRQGNWIRAELITDTEPADSFLRVFFHHSANSLGCNIAIRPLDREAIFLDAARSLILDARVPKDSELAEVGAVVRIVNGYMQHWQYSGSQKLRIGRGDFEEISMELDPRCWAIFESDGTVDAGPSDRPDFSIISSLNLSLGGHENLALAPTPGDGIIDIREIGIY